MRKDLKRTLHRWVAVREAVGNNEEEQAKRLSDADAKNLKTILKEYSQKEIGAEMRRARRMLNPFKAICEGKK